MTTSQRPSRMQFHEQDALAHQCHSTVRPSCCATSCATATSNPRGKLSAPRPVRGIAAGTAQNTRGSFSAANAVWSELPRLVPSNITKPIIARQHNAVKDLGAAKTAHLIVAGVARLRGHIARPRILANPATKDASRRCRQRPRCVSSIPLVPVQRQLNRAVRTRTVCCRGDRPEAKEHRRRRTLRSIRPSPHTRRCTVCHRACK